MGHPAEAVPLAKHVCFSASYIAQCFLRVVLTRIPTHRDETAMNGAPVIEVNQQKRQPRWAASSITAGYVSAYFLAGAVRCAGAAFAAGLAAALGSTTSPSFMMIMTGLGVKES